MTKDPKPWFPIRTERLLLREFRDSDLGDVHVYATDEQTVRYMDWGPNTPEETRKFLDDRLAEQQAWPRNDISLAVELAEADKVIGAIRIGLGPHDDADFGYSYGSPYWRRGFGYEAARALVATAFEVIGLHRVWATCDTRNRGSFAIMEKLGMRREGTLREHLPARGGGWRDTHIYGLLADEWAARAP
ncbi:GNAT family protein [Phenylobacterium sp.]|uniref:GNAT family N-acetyltransferase n=1 Tax=Phenylobacterium sp. TaxID=1871053 RepID=UPI002899CC59|nr:GNAT family protein [Phenylobacterium sp.]